MKAHLEMKIGILRAGPEFESFGDPYIFSCTILISGNECTIEGASGVFSKSMFSAIKKELKKHGIDKVYWERKKNKSKKIDLDI